MELVNQPTAITCGQSCIAMLTAKTVEQVIAELNWDKGMPPDKLLEGLDHYGIRRGEGFVRISRRNPLPDGVAILHVETNYNFSHWVLLYHGKYYDPKFGIFAKEYPHGKAVAYLQVWPLEDGEG
ncbi:MAG: hypothetical protein K6E50_12960 [Lachnospiraceae bacterium]|nr:hypothetical protein [Lachnospiraceae bacterium]